MTKKAPGRGRRGQRPRALVTGASSGIGVAFAERLAGDGYDVVLVARSVRRLEDLAARLHEQTGVDARVLPADLGDVAQCRRVEEVVAAEDHVDLLVNNAGFGTYGRFAESRVDGEAQEIAVNVVALMRLTRAALPGMVARRRGAVINVSSMAAFQPQPFNATYGATKAFVNSFTESLHEELRGTGVRVQVLCPGFTRTEFQERAGVDVSRIPDFAWMEAGEVVEASLAALERGTLVCVPGAANWALIATTGFLPRRLVGRVTGALMSPSDPRT
jgi:short-subunit dehydrogenase